MVQTLLPSAGAAANKLLALLPVEDYRRLIPDLRHVTLQSGDVLQRQAEKAQPVFFLRSGLCSIIRRTRDGQSAEVASIGNEGLVGVTAFFEDAAMDNLETVMLVGGDADSMSINAFRREIGRHGSLDTVVSRYVKAFIATLMTSAACNALHPIDKRCARWILQAHDRLGSDEVPVTHEMLAAVLGVRRASVTVAATTLHRAGLIDYGHRRLHVRNREGLEAAACECYSAMRLPFAWLVAQASGG